MRARRQPSTLVVPVLGGDITDRVLDQAADEARARGARLVILHLAATPRLAIGSPERVIVDGGRTPRWRLLAAAAPHGHVFVETMSGDPVRTVLSELERFPRASVMLDVPDDREPHARWAREIVDDLERELRARADVLPAARALDRRAPTSNSHAYREPSPC